MSFKSIYHNTLSNEGYHSDAGQATVVEHLDQLFAKLQRDPATKPGYINLWRKLIAAKQSSDIVQGCYLWGGVGRGKTWLMDLFFQAAPTESKIRFHFQEFMLGIHGLLEQFKGRKDPLKWVARHMTQRARLICVDEFHVSDITDAMLLYGLLEAMYQHGAVLVMTSNIPPDDLYKNGLQRSQFMPAIELLKRYNQIVQVGGDIDHRLRKNTDNRNYYCPLSPDTDSLLEHRFRLLAKGSIAINRSVTINKRSIATRMAADNIVWFDFAAICGGPRAASDYIALARRYDHVVISNIFRMDDSHDDMAKRFIVLVDEFYDRKTGLVVSATGWPQDLYCGERFAEEFVRTVSRMEEIRSAARYNHSQQDQSRSNGVASNTSCLN